ncbi:MAG TPA: PAS domain-containing protein [Nitrobacter sp.]|nr:PAS domain-containing protein [Nitrobacter sp.]
MTRTEFNMRGVGDPRLAVHATSHLPAWLWSTDGARVLWANPVGADVFGAGNATALAARAFGPADPHRRQIARLATQLSPTGAVRLERLRGFGAPLGTLVTCACARLEFPDGGAGVLVTTLTPTGRPMPLIERLQRLVDGIDTPIAAFASDGMFAGASEAARALLGFRNLGEAGLDAARSEALRTGRFETPIGLGHMVLQRVGRGADIGLVALLEPGTMHRVAAADATEAVAPGPMAATPHLDAPAPVDDTPPKGAAETTTHAETIVPPDEPVTVTPALTADAAAHPRTDAISAPDYEQPAATGEAPAEFTVFDALDDAGDEASTIELAAPESTQAGERETPPVQDNESGTEVLETEARQPETPAPESLVHEPSPYVEALADEPASDADGTANAAPAATDATAAPETGAAASPASAPPSTPAPAWFEQPPPHERRHPLRFTWQMDEAGRFSFGSDEFTRLIGSRTAAGFGRPWSEIADVFGLDPEGRVAKAIAGRDTWSGITVPWPADGAAARLPVEMSGLPIYDRMRNFAGYRGFGVCRDLEGLARLAAQRRREFLFNEPQPQPLSADAAAIAHPAAPPSQPTEPAPVETPQNVLPFRPANDQKSPALTPVENNAFNELARQLSARLENEGPAAVPGTVHDDADQPAPAETDNDTLSALQADWLSAPVAAPAKGDSARDRQVFDLLPTGVLIYRLDRLLYANRAFLERVGYNSLPALEEAGGLDALFVETHAPRNGDNGTPVSISTAQPDSETARAPLSANLHTISWDGAPAHALICAHPPEHAQPASLLSTAPPAAETSPAAKPAEAGHVTAEELAAILDTAAEGIVMFDESGRINACNRSAEALFGRDGAELTQLALADLFAPESQRAVLDYLDGVRNAGAASLLDHGREVLGRVREGGFIPLSMTMGRTRQQGPNFFAVFRDLSQVKKTETDLAQARRQADRAVSAKANVLARISHEVRTPLNAIIGFAEVMIGEKFGALGNERYIEYMKDIRASGERVIAIIDDLLDLSRIEAGKLDLAFTSQNLNEMVEQCVGVMQPQANRERIIIRTSLAHTLPPVVADARALRQITLNLIGNSIHLAKAGGQVIVSTAVTDFGDVALRVRDTGHGLNDNEVAAALEPFRTPAPGDQAPESAGVSLSLTKALVEANRAQFNIKTGAHAGTLIEVVFARVPART